MFCSWLDEKVEEKEKEINDKGDVWVCLIGHSMGGILGKFNKCFFLTKENVSFY
jgi:hypothetical protein